MDRATTQRRLSRQWLVGHVPGVPSDETSFPCGIVRASSSTLGGESAGSCFVVHLVDDVVDACLEALSGDVEVV